MRASESDGPRLRQYPVAFGYSVSDDFEGAALPFARETE